MIENERQYRISKAWVEKFARSAQQMAGPGAAADPLIQAAMGAQYQSQIEELQQDLADYDALRGGQVTSLEVESLTALPEALIRARIAAGLTQKELAERLGLKEQQVQRYESTRYNGVSLERTQAVVDALGVRIREHLTLPTAEKASSLPGT
jgi:ribosome-binding protein aMBF1 (putative translation factor)